MIIESHFVIYFLFTRSNCELYTRDGIDIFSGLILIRFDIVCKCGSRGRLPGAVRSERIFSDSG